jgi:DNA-binding PadR family transcriptional regulator
MTDDLNLTPLQHNVLSAVIQKMPQAYGVSIGDAIEQGTGKRPAIASIYFVLEQLEERGFVTSQLGDPIAKRGGRARLLITITAKGRRALAQSYRAIDAMRPVGLKGVLA